MQLTVFQAGKASAAYQGSDEVFSAKFNEPLVHQVVVAQLASWRAGTHAQKSRGEVSGGGRKPWKQKGTGQARAGSIRSPLWRKGGVTFAAKPQDYSHKVNKKMYRQAMRSILSEMLRQDRLIVVETLDLETPKTKALLALLKGFDFTKGLIVTSELNENVFLASRNLKDIEVMLLDWVNTVRLVGSEKVLITLAALKQIEESLV